MGFVAGDRVKETTATTGTGDLTLAGAVAGFQALSSIPGIADQDQFFYVVAHQTLSEWETGVGRWNSGAGTLTRLSVLESSNSDALVTFSAGTKDVFNALPAQNNEVTVNRYPKGNTYVPPGQSLYVAMGLEIASGKTLEIGSDAVLEIG